MAFNGGQRDDGVANSNNNNNNGSCCLCCCLCCSAQWSETVIKVKLTISERFTVDISHDSLVMRFSRIKDAAAVPSLSLFLSLSLCLPPSHAAQCNRIANICLVSSRLALSRHQHGSVSVYPHWELTRWCRWQPCHGWWQPQRMLL